MSHGWLKEKERGYGWAIRFMIRVALTFGRSVSRLFLYPITLYYYLISGKTREVSRQFLERALLRPARHWESFRHFFYFASVFLDRIYILSGGDTCLKLKVHGDQVFKEIQGQGCLVFGSHLGSFEIARTYGLSKLGYNFKIMMHVDQMKNTNSLLNDLNPEMAKTIIPIGDPYSLLQVREWVSQGQVVTLLADRAFKKEKTVSCPFLGHPAQIPTDPVVLAHILKVPVVLFFGIYKGGSRYELYFEKFADCIQLGNEEREKEIQIWVQKYMDRLSLYCRRAPYNWFNFYDYWTDS